MVRQALQDLRRFRPTKLLKALQQAALPRKRNRFTFLGDDQIQPSRKTGKGISYSTFLIGQSKRTTLLFKALSIKKERSTLVRLKLKQICGTRSLIGRLCLLESSGSSATPDMNKWAITCTHRAHTRLL